MLLRNGIPRPRLALVIEPDCRRILRSSFCSGPARRQADTSTASVLYTPLQERDNVRNIISLAQQVRRHAVASTKQNTSDIADEEADGDGDGPTASPHQIGRPYSRWWSKSWADVVQARGNGLAGAAGTPSTLGGRPLVELSKEMQVRLRQPKRMMDSYSSFPLPFRTRPEVLEQYISSWGGIRIGKLLEDLDSLAGDASYKHVLGRRPTAADHEGNPIFIVTASVDRLDLLEPLRADRDYRLNSMVIYVGSSSMEVLVTVEDISDAPDGQSNAGRAVLTGRFTMATRNAATGAAQPIPPLKIENGAEEQLFAQGQSHKQRKKVEASMSLEKVPPTSEEARLVHQLWLAEQAVPAERRTVHIGETKLSSVSYMHPQQRNVHMKIFGGYLMRSAYELAFMNASIFAKGKPVRFLSLDALSFHLPVSIGAFLSLTSSVTYTSTSARFGVKDGQEQEHSQSSVAAVIVLAELVDTSTGQRKKSNTFHFSFDLAQDDKTVLPESYHDSIAFIEGKRRVDHGNELRRISRTT